MSDLIDTTEMYLRTIYELEEEGIVPLRARIAERLHQSGPTVSQTVARMERDNLVHVLGDRHLELTDEGRTRATRVMRKKPQPDWIRRRPRTGTSRQAGSSRPRSCRLGWRSRASNGGATRQWNVLSALKTAGGCSTTTRRSLREPTWSSSLRHTRAQLCQRQGFHSSPCADKFHGTKKTRHPTCRPSP